MVQIFTPATFILGFLSIACLALPTADENGTTPVPRLSSLEDRNENYNTCAGSTFTRTTGLNSPTVADCAFIRDHLGPGVYVVHNNGVNELTRHGSCAFYAQAGNPGSQGYMVGNTDVVDLMRDAINRFQAAGRVAGIGTMPCQYNVVSGSTTVVWTIGT